MVQYQINGILQSLSKIERLIEGNWKLLVEDEVSEEAEASRTNLILEAHQEYIWANVDFAILQNLAVSKSRFLPSDDVNFHHHHQQSPSTKTRL